MNQLANIAKSILILICISASISYVIGIKYDNFWQSFIVISAIQIIGANFCRKIINIIVKSKNKKLDILEAASLSEAGVDVSCAFCGEINNIPVSFSGNNDFKCIKCGKENALYLNITTAQKTDTTISSTITVNSFDDNIEIVKNQILNKDE